METPSEAPTVATEKLFVAGVSWTTTDEAFSTYFSQFGEIEEAMIMRDTNTNRSRGFGFLTFKDPASNEKVLGQALQLDSRNLDVKKAVSKEDMFQQQVQAVEEVTTKKLYVAGVSYDCTEEGLIEFFTRFGEIESATIMKDKISSKSRGFGFVTFNESSSVVAVLEEHTATKLEMEGRTLDLKPAVPKGSPMLLPGYGGFGGRMAGAVPAAVRPKKIFVAGLALTTTQEALMQHFSGYGAVTDAYIQEDRTTGASRGFGFVTFEKAEDMEKVLQMEEVVLEGQKLGIKLATPKPQQGQRGGNGYGQQMGWGGMGRMGGGGGGGGDYGGQGGYGRGGMMEQQSAMPYHRAQGYQPSRAPANPGYQQAPAAQPAANAYTADQRYGQYTQGAYNQANQYAQAAVPQAQASAGQPYEGYVQEGQQHTQQASAQSAAGGAYGQQAQAQAAAYSQQQAPRAGPYGQQQAYAANAYTAAAAGYQEEGYGAYGDRRGMAARAVGFHPYSRN